MNEKLLAITFCSLTKYYWTVYPLQTNNYTFSFEYQNLHISVSISSRSWCEFHTDILKHIANNIQLHILKEDFPVCS
jgi:hypothetical protein